MGRQMPSWGRQPANTRRDARAKKAKATANQIIPSMLIAHPPARAGVNASELITESMIEKSIESAYGGVVRSSADATSAGPRLILQIADTLTAARALIEDNKASSGIVTERNKPRVAFLNMASPLSPGGGFFNGAKSQEESLCMRTTLLPSLKDEYYRLPEIGAIYTPDVLVFRDETGDEILSKRDRWYADCISAAMLRQPETDEDPTTGLRCYSLEKDRELVLRKMKLVMRICQAKGIRKVVVGAWGCGAYGNPLGEIAAAWRKVLIPKNKSRRGSHTENRNKGPIWDGVHEVVFAINDPAMAEAFASAFGEGLVVREEPSSDQGTDDEIEEGFNDDNSSDIS